jgi:rubrerythrin
MSNEKVIAVLKQIFDLESNDVYSYLREAEKFRRKIAGGDNVAEIFEAFGNQELRHSDVIAAELIRLGERPKVSVDYGPVEDSIRKVLREHIVIEKKAVELYSGLVKLDVSPELKSSAEQILKVEKSHLEKIESVLGKVDDSVERRKV